MVHDSNRTPPTATSRLRLVLGASVLVASLIAASLWATLSEPTRPAPVAPPGSASAPRSAPAPTAEPGPTLRPPDPTGPVREAGAQVAEGRGAARRRSSAPQSGTSQPDELPPNTPGFRVGPDTGDGGVRQAHGIEVGTAGILVPVGYVD